MDENLLEAASTLGRQIGQFFKRKRAEEALRDSEALKGAVLELALDCIVTIDEQSRVVEFNPAAETTFGYARDAVLGREMPDPHDPARVPGAAPRGPRPYPESGEGPILRRRIEMPAMRADGTIFPVELAITPIRAGGKTRFTAYLRDIGARKRAEKALRDSEAQFRDAGRQHPPVRLDGRAGRLDLLVQQALVRLHRHDASRRCRAGAGGRSTIPTTSTASWSASGAVSRAASRGRTPSRCAAATARYRWFLSRALPIQDETARSCAGSAPTPT